MTPVVKRAPAIRPSCRYAFALPPGGTALPFPAAATTLPTAVVAAAAAAAAADADSIGTIDVPPGGWSGGFILLYIAALRGMPTAKPPTTMVLQPPPNAHILSQLPLLLLGSLLSPTPPPPPPLPSPPLPSSSSDLPASAAAAVTATLLLDLSLFSACA
jgi:hypothetical protein